MSALEEELAVQLKAAGIGVMREFQFCPWRKWRADFRAGPEIGKSDMHLVEGGPLDGIILHVPNIACMEPCPACCVLVEVNGHGPQGRHGGWGHAESDAEKLSTAAALGWRCLVVTGKMVKDGRALALIEAALGIRALEAPKVEPKPRRSKRIPGRHKGKGLPERVRKAARL